MNETKKATTSVFVVLKSIFTKTIEFFKGLGAKFGIYMVSMAVLYGIIGFCLWIIYGATPDVQIITRIPLNTLVDYVVMMTLAYFGVNQFDKWRTDYKALNLEEIGTKVPRKIVAWVNMFIFLCLMLALYVKVYQLDKTALNPQTFDMGKLLFAYAIGTSGFMVSRATNSVLKTIEPPK